ADKVVAEIRAAGGTAIANKASVADRDGAKSIVEDAVNEFGTVDFVVNNAGILRDKSFKNMTLDDFDAVMQVHLMGTAYVTWHAWKIMYEKNFGRVVFTSSGSGIFGSFGQANYAAAKMGMVGLMNCLCREGASHNVRVNTLSPGAETRMAASIPGSAADPDNPRPEGNPALVTPAVLYLCSEDAPNGRIIQASGGRYATNAVFANEGVDLGTDATYEDLMANIDKAMDLSSAKQREMRQRQRQQSS
ncbi:MAG: SDR family NAD(P)-dependent oxidoreductase, partial [Pseudomonadales bacterium]